MRRPASILPPFASGDGCRGFRQAPRGGAPAGILTGMPTTVDNRGPGLDSGWLRYDDGHCCRVRRDAGERNEFNTLPRDGR